jgi:hypothetical protein
MSLYFTVQDEVTRHYRRFNAEGKELKVRLVAPPPASAAAQDPAQYFADSVDELLDYSLCDFDPSNMSVFDKATQSNARLKALDNLKFHVHSVKMTVGFGTAETSKGGSLIVMAHLKKSIMEVKSEENCFTHALGIAIARVNNGPDYKA